MNKEILRVTIDGDNTLKQFFDRFYVIYKNDDIPEDVLKFLKEHHRELDNENVANGKDGYIVFRGNKIKFDKEQIEKIKTDKGLTQRQLAKKYNCGVGTINRILNNKY